MLENRDTENRLMVAREEGAGGRELVGKGEGIKKHKMVVTKQSQGCKEQHRECSQQYCNNHAWCQVGTDNNKRNIV